MKNIVLLGSTGSIGTQVLDIVSRLPEKFRVVGLAANNNLESLANQVNAHAVPYVCIGSGEERAREWQTRWEGVSSGVSAPQIVQGVDGMCHLATLPGVDLVVVAVAGAIGIAPTHAAIEAGKTIALASKEVLVAAGEHTMRLAKRTGSALLPIDSEHSALFQCLQATPGYGTEGAFSRSVERLQLTASGGPFRQTKDLSGVTVEQALKHPTWNMGGLVTINSATLMNKGLEIIEARWLFDMAVSQIEVVIHPQSIVHSLVRFRDGSVLAQLGLPDMRLPIQYALVYPERLDTGLPRLDLTALSALTFEPPDVERFPSLRLAGRAAEIGGTMPAVMNAANEAAVARFLAREISFLGIMETVEAVMARHEVQEPTYQNVLTADAWARQAVG